MHSLVGEEKYKPLTLKCPRLRETGFCYLLDGCKLLGHLIICLSFPIPLVLVY